MERGQYISSKDKENVIVKEFWIKEGEKIRLVVMAEDKILRDEMTDLYRLPFFRLPSDIEPLSLYGQGWVKNIIPVNRLLNTLESAVAELSAITGKTGNDLKLLEDIEDSIFGKKYILEVIEKRIC